MRFVAKVSRENKIGNMKENQFETIKRLDDDNREYWSSRELASVLEYREYRNFLPAIEKAKEACANSGQVIHTRGNQRNGPDNRDSHYCSVKCEDATHCATCLVCPHFGTKNSPGARVVRRGSFLDTTTA